MKFDIVYAEFDPPVRTVEAKTLQEALDKARKELEWINQQETGRKYYVSEIRTGPWEERWHDGQSVCPDCKDDVLRPVFIRNGGGAYYHRCPRCGYSEGGDAGDPE